MDYGWLEHWHEVQQSNWLLMNDDNNDYGSGGGEGKCWIQLDNCFINFFKSLNFILLLFLSF